MSEERARAALRELIDAIPVPESVPRVEAAPRVERVPRARWVPALVVAAVALVIVGVALVPVTLLGREPAPPGAVGEASLPDRLAGGSVLTADVSRVPVGPAIAVYSQINPLHEDLPGQTLVLAAGRDAYRRVGVAECRSTDPRLVGLMFSGPLLSPDGSLLAVAPCGTQAVYGVNVVDLKTGRVRHYPAPAGSVVRPLAWAPDAKALAWVVAPDEPNPVRALNTQGRLDLLHMQTGISTLVPNLPPVAEAAFSPDGQRLVIQSRRNVAVVSLAGVAYWSYDLPAGYRLASNVAWSPDGGSVAATQRWAAGEAEPDGPPAIHVARQDGASALVVSVPVPGNVEFGGWHGSDGLVVRTPDALVALPVGGGSGNRLSTVADTAGGFRFAPALLASATVRDAGPVDRGPWPAWFSAALVVAVALVASVVAFGVTRRRRRPSVARAAAGTPQP